MTIRPLLLAACAALALPPAAAHDTWFEARPAVRGQVRLALGTGNQFPVRETGVDTQYLASSGCLGAQSGRLALRRVADERTALLLEPMRRPADGEALACWAQLEPFELKDLEPRLIEAYFKEIAASDAVRRAWAAMQARGLPWRERYTKHARIDLPGQGRAPATVPMAMDIVLGAADGKARAGEALEFQVLRDGAPLADFPVELRSERAALGVWRRTDAQGRVRLTVPTPGRWLLRGTDLRAVDDGTRWESGFVTLAFEVAPR